MIPIYRSPFTEGGDKFTQVLIMNTPWLSRTEARRECFQSAGGGVSYTYGKGRGVRTYTSIPYTDLVEEVLGQVNLLMDDLGFGRMNGCFLNFYQHDRQHLGWHADDFLEMDHTAPVVSVSFGVAREIWWRKFGEKGVVPAECRKLLESGSAFVMPPGMQHTHQHRIPKGSCTMGARVSMTFRRFL